MSESLISFLNIISIIGIIYFVVELARVIWAALYLESPRGKLAQMQAQLRGGSLTVGKISKLAWAGLVLGVAFLIAF